MQRVRELAVQSANGTNSAANRLALNTEATELIAAADEILTRTRFNDIDPFAATAINIHTGTDANQITILKGTGVLLDKAALSITAIDLTTQALANTALGNLDTGMDALNVRRSELGAAQNRLEFTMNVLAIKEENAAAAESSIRDADIARETTEFTRNQILVTAGTSLLAQANLIPQTALQLLG
jgi:flagellin